MTLEDIATKLEDLADQNSLDPDEFGGSESEYQYADGQAEVYSNAAGMIRNYLKTEGEQV